MNINGYKGQEQRRQQHEYSSILVHMAEAIWAVETCSKLPSSPNVKKIKLACDLNVPSTHNTHSMRFNVTFVMLVAVPLYNGDYNSGLLHTALLFPHEAGVYTRCSLEPARGSVQMYYE
jgi:hypothetical protein